jgi:hypothetical protein
MSTLGVVIVIAVVGFFAIWYFNRKPEQRNDSPVEVKPEEVAKPEVKIEDSPSEVGKPANDRVEATIPAEPVQKPVKAKRASKPKVATKKVAEKPAPKTVKKPKLKTAK